MSCDEIVIPARLHFLDPVPLSPLYQKSEAARPHAA
jgi:hypothetical protein